MLQGHNGDLGVHSFLNIIDLSITIPLSMWFRVKLRPRGMHTKKAPPIHVAAKAKLTALLSQLQNQYDSDYM